VPIFRFLLFAIVPDAKKYAHLRDVTDELDLNRRNRYFAKAVVDKTHMKEVLNGRDFDTCDPREREIIVSLLTLRARKKRKDALTKKDLEDIEAAWVAKSEVSPNKNDVLRKKKANGDEQVVSVHECYNRIEDVRAWLIINKHKIFALSTVYINKPWYIRKGKPDTCMCHYCENIRLAKKATMDNAVLLGKNVAVIKAIYLLKKCVIRWRRRHVVRIGELAVEDQNDNQKTILSQYMLGQRYVDNRTDRELNLRYDRQYPHSHTLSMYSLMICMCM